MKKEYISVVPLNKDLMNFDKVQGPKKVIWYISTIYVLKCPCLDLQKNEIIIFHNNIWIKHFFLQQTVIFISSDSQWCEKLQYSSHYLLNIYRYKHINKNIPS